MSATDPSDRVIVALDTATSEEARIFASRLSPTARFYKIGLGLLADDGIKLAEHLRQSGQKVFLDFKIFDIPSTVRRAVRTLVERIQPNLLTVHGDPHAVEAAVAGRTEAGGDARVLAVTVLTSMDRESQSAAMMPSMDLAELALQRGRRAMAAGADGLVASPADVAALRDDSCTSGAVIVTPGIRPSGSNTDDQNRCATPAEALAAGANHIVIGRPILLAADPLEALRGVIREIF